MDESRAGQADDKTASRARSLANLRPQQAGEPGHNKDGKNGRTLNKKIREWLEEKDGDSTRIGVVLKAAYENARLPDGTQDRKMLIEQYYGKPKAQIELGGPDGGPIPLGGVMVVPAPPAGAGFDEWQKQVEAEQDELKKGSEE